MVRNYWRRLSGLVSQSSTGERARPAPRPRRVVRPVLEALESRETPAVIATFPGLQATSGVEPPDTVLAVSTSNVVEAVNTSFEVLNKQGAVIGSNTFQSFFGPLVHAGDSFSDPYVVYDDVAGRFVMGILEFNTTNKTSFYDLAVSTDGTGAHWSGFQFDVSEAGEANGPFLADFPKIGFNADEVVVTSNQFPFQQSGFGPQDHILVLALNAPQLFNGTGAGNLIDVPITGRFATSEPTLFPASMHGSAPGDPMYFAETGDGSSTMLVVTGTNLLSTAPTFTVNTINVAAYQPAPAIPGVTNQIDDRVVSADWRAGSLVVAHTIGQSGDSAAHARWYEFNAPVSGSPALAQQGTITVSGGNAFFPSIAVNTVGGLGMTYVETTSAAPGVMSMVVTDRMATDAAGTRRPGNVPYYGAGTVQYNGTRAGDYSATVTDPGDGRTFWAGNEISTNTGAGNAFWGTSIAHFSAYSRTNTADFNGDGVSDILWVNPSNGADGVWYMRPPTSSQDLGVLGHGPTINMPGYVPVFGDFNGDGISDILWYNPTTGAAQIWYMRPPTSSQDPGILSIGPTFNLPVGFVPVTGDFNGDGVTDILWYNSINGTGNGIWYMRPPTSSQDLGVLSTGPGFNLPAGFVPVTGDFNGDGVTDILWYTMNGTGDGIWYMQAPTSQAPNGILSFGPALNLPTGFVPVTGDFNGDGVTDILWYNSINGTGNGIWYMQAPTSQAPNGVLSFGPGFNLPAGFVPVTGDFNGDGVTDILWYNSNGGTGDGIWYMQAPTSQAPNGVLSFGPAFNMPGYVPHTT
jgi:hypothetical protein